MRHKATASQRVSGGKKKPAGTPTRDGHRHSGFQTPLPRQPSSHEVPNKPEGHSEGHGTNEARRCEPRARTHTHAAAVAGPEVQVHASPREATASTPTRPRLECEGARAAAAPELLPMQVGSFFSPSAEKAAVTLRATRRHGEAEEEEGEKTPAAVPEAETRIPPINSERGQALHRTPSTATSRSMGREIDTDEHPCGPHQGEERFSRDCGREIFLRSNSRAKAAA